MLEASDLRDAGLDSTDNGRENGVDAAKPLAIDVKEQKLHMFITGDLNTGEFVADDGTLFFSDVYNHCVRKIDADGVIDTVAGICGERGTPEDGLWCLYRGFNSL